MLPPISDDGLTIGPFTANTIDGIFYIQPRGDRASLKLFYGILPGGEKMIQHDKIIDIDDSSDETRGVIIVGGIVPGTRLKIVSSEPIVYAEFLQQLK